MTKDYSILQNTEFGFVFELQNDTAFYSQCAYEIYLNDIYYSTSSKNIVSIFGLEPNTLYNVVLKGLPSEINFSITTKDLGFLINIKDYGAKGDGKTNDTSPIQAAIYTAPKGATVRFPKGSYLINSLFLKDGVNLYLEKNCFIFQNTKRDELAILKGFQRDYHHKNAFINSSWEGNPLDCYQSLIYGKDVSDISIYGEGIINGSGKESGFWKDAKCKNIAYRPRNISLYNSKNISISGIASENSACWNIHPYCCDNVNFYDVKIKSSEDSPNTDGINPECCNNVTIAGCNFDVGDDCIAIKSGKVFISEYAYRPSANINIRNCMMQKGHGAVVIGSEISCGAKNIVISKCYFKKTDRGLRIKSRRGRGKLSVIEGIKFQNVIMDTVRHCFVINMFYNCDPDGNSEYVRSKKFRQKGDDTPSIRDIEINELNCINIIGSAIFMYGLPESNIQNIIVKDAYFSFCKDRINECPDMMDDFQEIENLGIFLENVQDVSLVNNKFNGQYVNLINGRNE